MILTGAGISTGCGIPDFRSEGGLFEQIRERRGARFPKLQKMPELVLHRSFARKYPELWTTEVDPWLKSIKTDACPSAMHRVCATLAKAGLVKRIYTQNIDGLHTHKTLQMPEGTVVECHGSISRNDVVLYDDPLPETMYQRLEQDLHQKCNVTCSWSLAPRSKSCPSAQSQT